MKEKIENLIKRHYKTFVFSSVVVEPSTIYKDDDCVEIVCSNYKNAHYIALRILNKFPNVRMVTFSGEWIEMSYTRETLRWGGLKVK